MTAENNSANNTSAVQTLLMIRRLCNNYIKPLKSYSLKGFSTDKNIKESILTCHTNNYIHFPKQFVITFQCCWHYNKLWKWIYTMLMGTYTRENHRRMSVLKFLFHSCMIVRKYYVIQNVYYLLVWHAMDLFFWHKTQG